MYGAGCWAYNERCDRPGVAVATSGNILFINQTVISICMRDDLKVLIIACYLCNQQCNMSEKCTK